MGGYQEVLSAENIIYIMKKRGMYKYGTNQSVTRSRQNEIQDSFEIIKQQTPMAK
jgi:hypothetical protein